MESNIKIKKGQIEDYAVQKTGDQDVEGILNFFQNPRAPHTEDTSTLPNLGQVRSEIIEQAVVLQQQINNINVLLNSDNIDLDNLQELVDAIERFQLSLDTILVNDLSTGGTTKALTAEMGKQLNNTKESLSNKSLSISPLSTNFDYPSSKAVYDFVNEFIQTENNLTTSEVLDLVESSSLIPGNYYLVNDFQTIYTINGSDSSPLKYPRKIGSVVSGYAVFDVGYDYNLIVGKPVVITKLPEGYAGGLVIGSTTTISVVASSYYFRFANGMQNVIGLEFEYSMPKYANGIVDNLVVNDVNGKPVIKPGGVLNTEVHDGTAYMNMTASENLGVPIESIILKAKSTNEFELEGKSVTYPDDVIEYKLPEAGSAATKGTILRRYNNALNIDLRVDWRVKRFRRWKISADSILKILNQNESVTSLTGFEGVYQFTATTSSTATPERFYIADNLDKKALTIDTDTKIVDFIMEVSSYTDAKDFPIFQLDGNHYPLNVTKMKVSGGFDNAVIQKNSGELNLDTDIDAEMIYDTTFVCSVVIKGSFVSVSNSLILDSFWIGTDVKSTFGISNTKILSFINIVNPNNSFITNSIIGINTNNYNGTPYPAVRWVYIKYMQSSLLNKVLLGGSQPEYTFNSTSITDSTLFFYLSKSNHYSLVYAEKSKLIFSNCLMISMSIFNRARVQNFLFDSIMCDVDYAPASGRDVYVNSTDLKEIKIKMNKYTRKLYYEELDALDVSTINTYADPLP